MANVITLIDQEDKLTLGKVHYIIRRFQYTRDAGDNIGVFVTPTEGVGVTQKLGVFVTPWAGVIGISMKNNSGGSRAPVFAPLLFTSLANEVSDITTGLEGTDLETLQTRSWDASWSDNQEIFRSWNVGSLVAGGRLYWLVFQSENALAADWTITVNVAEAS